MSTNQTAAVDVDPSEEPIRPIHVTFVIVCILAAVADGFDLLGLSYAAPMIVQEWSITPAMLGTVFSASMAGAVVGAIATERLARYFSRPTLISMCLAMFGAGTLAATLTSSSMELLVVRFVTGIALGATMPLLLASTAQFLPKRIRGRCAAFVIGGIPLGGILAGLASAWLVTDHGWRILFIIGGIFPFLLIPFVQVVVGKVGAEATAASGDMTEEGGRPARAKPTTASYLQVFREDYSRAAILILMTIFAATLLSYFLSQWVPSLLATTGSSQERASTQGALLNLGAVIAVYVFGYIMDRFGVIRISLVGYACAIPCVILLGYANNLGAMAGTVLVLAGFFGIGLKVGGTVVIAKYFPPKFQVATVSLGYIATRAGAIVGPMLAGFLLSANLDVKTLFYVMTLPALIAALCMYALLDTFEGKPGGTAPDQAHASPGT